MRSEFDEAEDIMSELIAHARTALIFDEMAPQITLLHAYFSHATGQADRALECYRAVAFLRGDRSFMELAAQVGEIALRIGQRYTQDSASHPISNDEAKQLQQLIKNVIQKCKTFSGTLNAYGKIFEATITPEITETK